jgi:hypothetical protein
MSYLGCEFCVEFIEAKSINTPVGPWLPMVEDCMSSVFIGVYALVQGETVVRTDTTLEGILYTARHRHVGKAEIRLKRGIPVMIPVPGPQMVRPPSDQFSFDLDMIADVDEFQQLIAEDVKSRGRLYYNSVQTPYELIATIKQSLETTITMDSSQK